MGRRSRTARRTPRQAAADRLADELSGKLGKMLRDGRRRLRLTQAQASAKAGISPGTWANLENEKDGRVTTSTWSRAAMAADGELDAYIKRTTAADQPRDAVHLRHEELLIRMSGPGGWRALPEEQIDREARTSRWGDVLLQRRLAGTDEYGLFEIFDWFDNVGDSTRDWLRRLDALERYAIARMRDDNLPHTSGCWIVRATARNRQLIADHTAFFRSRFPGSGRAWLATLANADVPMPVEPALLWVDVAGRRIFEARLGSG